MTTLAPKRPAEVRKYVFDYSHELGGDPIASSALTVTFGAVKVNSVAPDGPFRVVAFIGGGTDGQTSTLRLVLETEEGQTLQRDFSLLTALSSNATGALPSSTTKGQVMNMAFGEIGLPGYAFDASSTEQADALMRLDVLMATLASPGENLDLGYNFPSSIGGSAIGDISGIPDLALDFVVGRLALSLAPNIGKTLSAAAQKRMAISERAIRATWARIPHMRLPRTTARGSGAKPWSTWWPFIGNLGFGQGSQATATASGQVLGTETGHAITTEDGVILGLD